jgi:hypothetical protein
MRSDSFSRRHLSAPLAYRIADDSTAAEIAAACGALWLELVAVLSPIIGPRGVTALGQRSLHLANLQHPWLGARQPGGPATLDSTLLQSLLAQRSSDEAVAAADTFLQTFRELLSSLVGVSLTERLLRTVWGPPDTALNSTTAQDPTP